MERKTNIKKIAYTSIYVFLALGALWHHLGMFVVLREWMATPILITMATIMFSLTYKNVPSKKKISSWAIFVVLFGFGVEWVGTQTGWPFGNYHYTTTLKAQIDHVPIAIAFAWMGLMLYCFAISTKLSLKLKLHRSFVPLLCGLGMCLIDVLLEPAAIELHYWVWNKKWPGIENYLAWGIISTLFGYLGMLWHTPRTDFPPAVYHFGHAQLLYFLLVVLSSFYR